MIGTQPLLNLQLAIAHCAYDLYVNGGLVERNGEAQPVSGTQPINHWLRSGENEVAVYMYKWPEDPDECDVSLSLELSDASLAQQPPVKLMTLVHKAKQAPAWTSMLLRPRAAEPARQFWAIGRDAVQSEPASDTLRRRPGW